MRTRHKKNYSDKGKAVLFKKIKWWGIASIALVAFVTLLFGGSSITAKAANFLASFNFPARSAEDTAPYPYFKPDTQVQVYSGIGVNGWKSVPYRLIRKGQEYLYEERFYDIDPNGWVRFNSSVTATDTSLTEADRVFEPYNSRVPEPEDLVRFVDSQNNHLRHNLAGACQAGDYFWFQGALYYCAANPENPTEYVVTSTYHVLNAEGRVIPVEEFALARGDSLEDVYGSPVSYPVNYANNSVASPALDGGSGLPTDYGFTGHRLDSATGLMYMNSRFYDPQLGRFISPDTIIPERYDSTALDRYAYARNNPAKYIDPSGHCWGIASGIRGLPTYDVTCNNLDMALSIVQHAEVPLEQRVGAATYITAVGGSHLALAAGAGMLAWEAVTTAGTAACADGDCTNEVQAGLNVGKRTIDFMSSQLARVQHIMDSKHAWDSLVELGDDVSANYEAVQPYIQQTIETGTGTQINITPEGHAVMEYMAEINGQVVIVRAVQMGKDLIQITDAWVKTK